MVENRMAGLLNLDKSLKYKELCFVLEKAGEK